MSEDSIKHSEHQVIISHTGNISKISVDSEVCVWGDNTALKHLLTHNWGERMNGCADIRLNQPRVLWTWHTERLHVWHTTL